jgi:hydroxyethylthiazole kinase-like uncharacterized protein yjeF
MKILSAEQIRELDAYTIAQTPIASLDLMEQAAATFARAYESLFPERERPAVFLAGMGNNGGDAFAVARLLSQRGYSVSIHWCQAGGRGTPDLLANVERLPRRQGIHTGKLHAGDPLPNIDSQAVLVDGLFGAGLNRPVEGYWAELLRHCNAMPNTRVAIDIPSGLFADQPTRGAAFQAHFTLSFQTPKLAFFFAENQDIVGEWRVLPIGLHAGKLAEMDTPCQTLEADMIAPLIRPRKRHDHKGIFGHVLLIAGARGTAGAAVLATRAALRAGVGLATAHAPKCAYEILQASVPEAMVSVDCHDAQWSEVPALDRYQAVGVGCGVGQQQCTMEALTALLERIRSPIVLDADALNLMGRHKELLERLPLGAILTPHPKEFERLFGATPDSFARLTLARRQAQASRIVLILKGAYTLIACPDGACYFNTTGNPGMASAGSGDVLTGVLAALLAQGYAPRQAALAGVYLHGLAGDLAAAELGQESMLAGDITHYLGKAFSQLKNFSHE